MTKKPFVTLKGQANDPPAGMYSPRRNADSSALSLTPRGAQRKCNLDAAVGSAQRGDFSPNRPSILKFPPISGKIHQDKDVHPGDRFCPSAEERMNKQVELKASVGVKERQHSDGGDKGKGWNMLKTVVHSTAVFKEPGRSIPQNLHLSQGHVVNVQEMLKLKSVFESMSNANGGQVPVSRLSRSISKGVNNAVDTSATSAGKMRQKARLVNLDRIGKRKNEHGQPTLCFSDLLKLHFPGITSQDIALVLETLKKAKLKVELGKLDVKAAKQAGKVWKARMAPRCDNQIEGIRYEDLLDGIQDEFPHAMNIHNALKTIDAVILKRLREGGLMTRNEFTLWYANKLNTSVEVIWTPNHDNQQKGSHCHHDQGTRDGRLSPSAVLSGYISGFEHRQQAY